MKWGLQVFRYNLNLQYSFTAEELETALAESPGNEGLLADIHIVNSEPPSPCLTTLVSLSHSDFQRF